MKSSSDRVTPEEPTVRGGRAELERLRAAHINRCEGLPGYCAACYDWYGIRNVPWPCDASRLIAALEEALVELERIGDVYLTRRIEAKLTASQDLRKASSEPTK